MTNFILRFLILAFSLLLLTSAAFADPGKNKSGKNKEHSEHKNKNSNNDHKNNHKVKQDKEHSDSRDDDWSRNLQSRVIKGRFDVPPGYRPSAGMCRRWYTNIPPGQQPAPEECGLLSSGKDFYILYGDYGYDPRYDWVPATDEAVLRNLPHQLLDILIDRVR